MSVPAHFTPLRLAQPISTGSGGSCPTANTDDLSWLGTEVESPRPDTRRFLTDLSLPVRGGSHEVQFRKAAYVDLGSFEATADGCQAEVSWRSSSMAPLFPVFAGRIAVTSTEVVLDGFYAPPGGQVGAVLDRAFLNIAARGTARWFLERFAAEVAGRREPSRADRESNRAPSPVRRPAG